jgi:hypothetical protein
MKVWLSMQSGSNFSPREFPAKREKYMEFLYRPTVSARVPAEESPAEPLLPDLKSLPSELRAILAKLRSKLRSI